MVKRNHLRDEAISQGGMYYTTGQPCIHGHVSPRYVSTHQCIQCHQDRMAATKKANAIRKEKRPLSPRRLAMKQGELYYNTGQLCSRGHAADRLTINGACVECTRLTRISNESDELKDKRKIYRRNNAERYRTHVRNRRALLKNAEGSHSHEDIERLWTLQNGRCKYCNCMLADGYHVDHIIALSKGGANSASNLQLTCPSCNRRKHNKDPEQFAKLLKSA